MKVLEVCGSPHSNGLYVRLLKKVLEETKETGVEFGLVFLVKYGQNPKKSRLLPKS